MTYEFDWHPEGDPEDEQIIFETNLGPQKYQLKIGDRATVESWKMEISLLHQAIIEQDWERLQELMANGRYKRDIMKVMAIQQKENLDEEGKKLLAIALLLMKHQSDWRGFVSAGWKLIKGGVKNLDHYFDNNNSPSCLDAAVMVEYLTELFGVSGKVRRVAGRYSHWFWESESGKVIDIWWGYGRGGVYGQKNKHLALKRRFTLSGRVTDVASLEYQKSTKEKQ